MGLKKLIRVIKKTNPSYGFTLVETLIVMLIIGIIIAIILPNVQRQSDQSKIAATKANLETIRMAVQMYRVKENIWPNSSLSRLHDGTSPSTTVYLSAIPPEEITGSNMVSNSSSGGGGWFWSTTTRTVRLNLLGTDANGNLYGSY